VKVRSFLAQLVRYAAAGGTSALLYVVLTLLLAGPVGLPIQVAIPPAYVLAVIVNFALQRHFVFRHNGDFALPIHHQAGYYVVVGVIVVGGSAAATTWLPPLLDVSEEAVYLGTVVLTPLFTYAVFRLRVFRPAPPPPRTPDR
jgi:putative flippase GtrA